MEQVFIQHGCEGMEYKWSVLGETENDNGLIVLENATYIFNGSAEATLKSKGEYWTSARERTVSYKNVCEQA